MSNVEINLRITGRSSQGGRKYMEDCFVVAYQHTEDKLNLEYAFFGIFDGHGGKEAAEFAKSHLLDNIVSLKQFWDNNDDMVLSAIREGFLLTHNQMWKEVDNWPKTPAGLPSTAGTTASVAFIRNGKLYTGHVGDSRIVIGINKPDMDEWQAASLTVDHKPESPVEKQRIINSGGMVLSKSGVERVVWKRPRPGHDGPVLCNTDFEEIPFLAVARSLGDLWSFDYFQKEFAVSPEPDVGVLNIDLDKDKCLILASDGLWNIMSPLAAVHLVQDVENENRKLISKFGISENIHLTLCNPSKVLVDCALERWNRLRTRADNVSVVTIMLGKAKCTEDEVLKDQLVLKMNHAARFPIWNVRFRSKSWPSLEENGETKMEVDSDFSEIDAANRKLGDCCLSSSDSALFKIKNVDKPVTFLSENKQISPKELAVTSSSFVPSSSGYDSLKTSDVTLDSISPLESCSEPLNELFSSAAIPEVVITESSPEFPPEANITDPNAETPPVTDTVLVPIYQDITFQSLIIPPKVTVTDCSDIEDDDGDEVELQSAPCPIPRWSKSSTGRTSLLKLATWSKMVNCRRMSDPFPSQNLDAKTYDDYSLSDDENTNYEAYEYGFGDDEEIEMRPCLLRCCSKRMDSDMCNDGCKNCDQKNVKIALQQLSNIKQAIKRKYPGTEISNSIFGRYEETQRKKLDLDSNLLGDNDLRVQS